MFDINNVTHRQELRDELINDPEILGYAAVAEVTREVLELLNDPSNNPGSPTINRPIEELDVPEISAVIDDTEFAALSEYGKEWVRMFISQPSDALLKPYQQKFTSLFGGGSVTVVAVIALRTKPASRAETLWGVNSILSRADLNIARNE